jgi:hypothetical protein
MGEGSALWRTNLKGVEIRTARPSCPFGNFGDGLLGNTDAQLAQNLGHN